MANPTRTKTSNVLGTPHLYLHPSLSLPLPSLYTAHHALLPLLLTIPPPLVPGQAPRPAAFAPTIRPYSHSLLLPANYRSYTPTVYSNPRMRRHCGLRVGTPSAPPRVHQELWVAHLATLLSLWTMENFQKSLLATCNSKPNRFAESVCRSGSSKPKRRRRCSSGI